MSFEGEGNDDSGTASNIKRGCSFTFLFVVEESFALKVELLGSLNFFTIFISVGYVDDENAFDFECEFDAKTDDTS